MNFTLTEEQAAIREMALDFAKERIAPNAGDWDRNGHFPVEEMRAAAELGMGAIMVPESDGGSGLSRLDAALIFEALAYGCPTTSAYLSIHNMVAGMVARFGSEEQKEQWLPKLISMDWLTSYCLTEPSCGSDAAALKTSARSDGEDYILNGTKQFISGAGTADFYLVFARTGAEGPSGISAIVIEKDTPGLSFGANEKKMGWNAQPTRQVIMEDVRVPKSNLLGNEGDGFKFAMMGLDGGRINIAACSIGAAWSACDQANRYMQERTAFGKNIGQFQALQFKTADMATELEAARMMTYRAAHALDTGDPDANTYCAMAKRFATDAGSSIANEALQIHGGYGYLHEYGMEKIVRDLRVHQILEGTNEIMRVIISRNLLAKSNAQLH